MTRHIAHLAVFAALLTFAAVAFAPPIFNDGDTYWHLAAGARMLDTHAVLHSDPFSYTFRGAPWNAHEWLSEIAMALAYRAGGFGGVALLFAFAFALTAGLLCRHLGRFLGDPARAIVLVLALSCMAGSLLARPHILALPLLELWTFGLVAAREEKRAPPWHLLAVMTLWANLHGGFAFGFLVLGFLGLEALAEERSWKTFRSWAFFAAGALAAAALTPNFLDGLLFPLRLAAMHGLANVGEWQPTSFAALQPFELVVLAALYFFLSRGVALPVSRILMALVLLHLALQHQRHQIVFAVTAPLLLAGPAARALAMTPIAASARRAGSVAAAALIAFAAIAAARLSLAMPRGGAAVTPAAALAHVPPALRAQPVLNEYGFGGYLIFEGVKPFIDSRAELYGDAFIADYARIVSPDPAALKATLAKYAIRWTILIPGSPASAMMDLMPGWRRLYADDVAVVHVPIR